MFQHSIVIGACVLLTTLSGTKAHKGQPPCPFSDCVKPYNAYDTQNDCFQELRPPQWDCRWYSGMDGRADEIIYGGRIAAYRIQWFAGGWSGWFIPGLNDIDSKFNPAANGCPGLSAVKNGLRRTWGMFNDHTHHVIICYSPVKCTKDTSVGPYKAVFPDPYVLTKPRPITVRGQVSGPVDFANAEDVAALRDGARVDGLLDQGQGDGAIDVNQEVDPGNGDAQADG